MGAVRVALARALALVVVLNAACSSRDRSAPDAEPAALAADPLARLRAFEETRRAATDFRRLPPSDRARGADPYAIRKLPASAAPARFAGILRGRDAVVLLDSGLHEIDRAPTAASPSGIAVTEAGEVFVVGEQSTAIHRHGVARGRFHDSATIATSARALRDVAVGPEQVLYAVEERDGRLLSIPIHGGSAREIAVGAGALRVARASGRVVVDSLLGHTVAAYEVDPQGFPLPEGVVTIHHDGPIWGFDAVEVGDDLLIAAGGVEDHPLDRTGGSFGFIDSFVFLYRIARGASRAERLAAINVSALSVVTPKAVLLRAQAGLLEARVAGYGSDRLLTITFDPRQSPLAPVMTTAALLPGVAAMTTGDGAAIAAADPLLDVWLGIEGGAVYPVAAEDPGVHAPPPSAESRLGEALFFTTAMAPWNSSEGPLSRFTCETCHFEGQTDGRIHHTGRGDVHATTKPLLGLFNNGPHFTRALDPDLTTVAHNEFRVAGARSDHDAWFAAPVAEQPWILGLGVPEGELGPEALRKALMVFLMDFTPRPNPSAIDHAAFTALERAGAEAFARRCEGCHAARIRADDPASRLDPTAWERLVLSREGAIVWATSEYRKTGIEPYVHADGARVSSLRRLYKKRPYFTNGSANGLGDVLSRARFGGASVFFHDGAPDGLSALPALEKEALRAFLDLL